MGINRKAILISSPLSTGTDIGTNTDLRLWEKFLMSPNGGCWKRKDEIQPFISPTSDVVINYIRNLKVNDPELGYVFFAFSGHGQKMLCGDAIFTSNDLNDFLPVSNIKQEIENLKIPATIILDACRHSSRPSSVSNTPKKTSPLPRSNLNFRSSVATPQLAFEWRKKSIKNNGVVLIQSCDDNEESMMVEYSDIKCSLFTSELIKVGLNASNSMSIQKAFSQASSSTTTISTRIDKNRVQKPKISNQIVVNTPPENGQMIENVFCLGSKEIAECELECKKLQKKIMAQH